MWIILFSLLSVVQPTHEFYLGLVELNQNATTHRLEISVRLFTDDLEDALRVDAGLPLNLGTETEIGDATSLVATYLQDRFELKVDESPVELNFLGGETEDDAHWFYLESATEVPTGGKLTIYCSFLTDLYREQENIIQLNLGNLSTRQVFTSDRQLDTFDF